MANFCEVCGKGTMSGMNVSHSHVKRKNLETEYPASPRYRRRRN